MKIHPTNESTGDAAKTDKRLAPTLRRVRAAALPTGPIDPASTIVAGRRLEVHFEPLPDDSTAFAPRRPSGPGRNNTADSRPGEARVEDSTRLAPISKFPSAPVLPRLAYSLQETAAMLGVCTKTVRRLVYRDLLHRVEGVRHIIIPRSEIERLLQSRP